MNKSLSILYYGIAIAVCVCLTDWRAGQRAVASCPDDFATEVATENFFRINEPSSVFINGFGGTTFEQFGAFSQDAADNKALLAKGGKITMPVFAIGAEKVFGKGMADEMRFAASNVTGGIVPNSGHWIMEENRQATIKLVTDFLAN